MIQPPLDAVISIGGPALLDGFWRLVGPALQAVRAPLPIALPGMANSVLRIRNLGPYLAPAGGGKIRLDVQVELAGEIPLATEVAAGSLNLTLGKGTIALPKSAGTIGLPPGTGAIDLDPATGTISGFTPIQLNRSSGTLTFPTGKGPLSLDAVVGTIDLPSGIGDAALPIPAVVPVAVDVTSVAGPIKATVLLDLAVSPQIGETSGFGLFLTASPASVTVSKLPDDFATRFDEKVQAQIDALMQQLGVAKLLDTTLDVAEIASNITKAIPTQITSTLNSVLSNLMARTGRLVFAAPDGSASCDVLKIPTHARAKIGISVDGAPFVQIGFARKPIPATVAFPTFIPTKLVNVQIDVSNSFLLELICCLLTKLPNLNLPPISPGNQPQPRTETESKDGNKKTCCVWDNVALSVGIIALKGTLKVCIVSPDANPNAKRFV